MILREAQNRKNNKEYFSYFELLFKRLIIRWFLRVELKQIALFRKDSLC